MYTLVDLFGFLQFVSGRCVAQYCKAVEKLFVKSQKMGRVEVTSPFEPRYLPRVAFEISAKISHINLTTF